MFELLFKYPSTVFRKGEFLFASGWPVWLLILAIAAAGAGLFWHIKRNPGRLEGARKFGVWGAQAAMAALALFLLWQPAIGIQSLRPQQNVVSVLLDTSRSMAFSEPGGLTRIEQAVAALEDGVISGLEERFRVRLYGFAGGLERIENFESLPAPGNATRLGDALASVLRESAATPLGAVVVVSDGSDNSGSFSRELMAEIRKRNVPVHTVGVGREKIPGDVELSDVSVTPRALPRSRVSAQVTIRHPGEEAATRLTVRDGSRILASKEIALRRGENVQSESIDFPAGEPGIRDLRFSVDPLPGEEITGNNTQVRVMDVPRGRKRILYIEGEPRWEYKFMRRAVHNDASVQVTTLLRTSTNKYYRQGVDSPKELEDGFPLEKEELFAYDALIVGSFEAAFFTPKQQSMIREFVNKRGGSLLMIAGRNGLSDGGWGASQVAEILPARLAAESTHNFVREKHPVFLTLQGRESLICRLSEDPKENETLWREMPAIADYQALGELKPAAITLLETEAGGRRQPLLVYQNYGRGKSMILATGGTWRWQMGLPHEDARHHTFWRQLLRSLVANSPTPVTLSSDQSLYADNPLVRLRAEVRNKEFEPAGAATVTATITPEAGEPSTVEMVPSSDEEGVFTAEVTAAAPGSYRIQAAAYSGSDSIGSAAIHIRREDGIAEDFRPGQNRELLMRVAEQTGGRYWPLNQLSSLPEEIRFSEAGITAREILDLWDMPAVFLLLICLKSAEWLLRRRWGVV